MAGFPESDMAEDEEVKLSPEDIEKLKGLIAVIDQASATLNDIPEDVREEYGNLDDAIAKLEEVSELIGDCLPEDAAGGESA